MTYSTNTPPAALSHVTLQTLQDESSRAHRKHSQNGGQSLLDAPVNNDWRLAAVGEEFGEVCRAYLEYRHKGQTPLVIELIQLANTAASWAQSLSSPGETVLTTGTLAAIRDCPVTWHLNHISNKLVIAHRMLTLLGTLIGELFRANNPLLNTDYLRTRLLQLANAACTWAQDLEEVI